VTGNPKIVRFADIQAFKRFPTAVQLAYFGLLGGEAG
jgi:hypothetical protein